MLAVDLDTLPPILTDATVGHSPNVEEQSEGTAAVTVAARLGDSLDEGGGEDLWFTFDSSGQCTGLLT